MAKNEKMSEMTPEERAEEFDRRKAKNGKKEKAAKEQVAQTQTNPNLRDTAPKPSAPVRKSSEAQPKPAVAAAAPQPAPKEPHVPMNGFNAAVVEAMLAAGAADEGELYKPPASAAKASGAWAAKPGTMANGKNFWDELKRQVAEMQANGGAPKEEKTRQGG